MRITESQLRQIVRQEAARLVNRNLRESMYTSASDKDPAAYVKEKMAEIERLFTGGYDPDDAMSDAEQIIEEVCFDLNEMLHSWLMDYLKDDQAARAEYNSDIMDDR